MAIGRLIPPLSGSGALQMALDEWLLEQHRQGVMPPVLRFYTWEPVVISLGYHQRHWPEAWANLHWQEAAVELVRRPSGGRAVLHQGDLTYALVISPSQLSRLTCGSGPLGLVNRQALYRYLCEFLVVGGRSLGLPLQFGDQGRGYIHNPNCFGTATRADLVLADGTKWAGSAQLCRQGAVLQHGSLRVCPDASLFRQVFGGEDFSGSVYLPLRVTLDEAIAALTAAAEACLGIRFEPQPLGVDEWTALKTQVETRPKVQPPPSPGRSLQAGDPGDTGPRV